eukprot:12408187-Ditylum_brightwellii.AAC.1
MPTCTKFDNEASTAMLHNMVEKSCTVQLALPNMHRQNLAEQAIRTFKSHFLAGIASVDPEFPRQLWDKLISQACLTLNVLHPSRVKPQLSTEAQLKGGGGDKIPPP